MTVTDYIHVSAFFEPSQFDKITPTSVCDMLKLCPKKGHPAEKTMSSTTSHFLWIFDVDLYGTVV